MMTIKEVTQDNFCLSGFVGRVENVRQVDQEHCFCLCAETEQDAGFSLTPVMVSCRTSSLEPLYTYFVPAKYPVLWQGEEKDSRSWLLLSSWACRSQKDPPHAICPLALGI